MALNTPERPSFMHDAHSRDAHATPLLTLEANDSNKCAKKCCCTVCLLLIGFPALGAGASLWVALTWLIVKPPPLPEPFIPHCGACSASLEGHFTARVSKDAPFGGIKYDITHAFHSRNGTADVLLHVLHSPAGMLSDFTCYGVPFAVDVNACNMTLTDQCLVDAYKASLMLGMYLTWDGGGNLTVVEDIDVPVLGKRRYVWTEHRVAGRR